MKEKFGVTEDFVLNRYIERIVVDVKYKGYDLELIIEYEVEAEKVTKFMVWTSGRGGYRFWSFGIDYTVKGAWHITVEEMLNIVYDKFVNDEINFDDVIDIIKMETNNHAN